jgi:hypothetical protein
LKPAVAAITGVLLCALSHVTCAADSSLPDWNGWWTVAPPVNEEWLRQLPPLNQRALALWESRLDANSGLDPLRYCRPLSFTGYSGGFEGALEFLFTPGRVTMTSEDGRLRRIYTDGRAIPANQEASASGTSVGHWEGQALVVVTTHLDPQNAYPTVNQGTMTIGRDARITERITLRDADTLVFDIETIAPEVLRGPDRRTRMYKRTQKSMAQELTFCARNDRSVDADGRQRFDMTPPPDLPPPPPRKP